MFQIHFQGSEIVVATAAEANETIRELRDWEFRLYRLDNETVPVKQRTPFSEPRFVVTSPDGTERTVTAKEAVR